MPLLLALFYLFCILVLQFHEWCRHIQDIYLEERQANQQAKELSQKGITCVVKEYLIDESYQEEIQKKNYKRIYPLLKQVDTK